MFADEFVGREPFERLQSAAKIVGVDEVQKVPTELVVIVVVEAFDGRVLDGSIHAFYLALHLAFGPRMIDLGEPVLDAVLVADPIEDMVERIFVARMVRELDAVVGQDGVDDLIA